MGDAISDSGDNWQTSSN